MIETEFIRSNAKKLCTGCKTFIETQQPFFIFRFNNSDRNFCLCEDCGHNLQNDMNDEYQRFVDMRK